MNILMTIAAALCMGATEAPVIETLEDGAKRLVAGAVYSSADDEIFGAGEGFECIAKHLSDDGLIDRLDEATAMLTEGMTEDQAKFYANALAGVEARPITVTALGFVNVNTTNDQDGRGDGIWYSFESRKVRHVGDTIMTRSQAERQGIKAGE